MGEANPQFDNALPLATIQAKLTAFSRHCSDLLQESVCLLDEIARFSDLISLFTPLNSALEAFLLESPRFDAYFKTLEASCSQEEESLSNNSVRLGITKDEAEEEEEQDPVVDTTIVCQGEAENIPMAMPKFRIRIRKPKPPCRLMAKKENMMKKKKSVRPTVAPSISTSANEVAAGLSQKPRRGVFTCTVCDTRIASKSGLKRHMSRWHSGVKLSNGTGGVETKPKAKLEQHKDSRDCSVRFQCEVCDTRIASKSGLKRHMIRWHSGAKLSSGAGDVEIKPKTQIEQHKISVDCSLVFRCAICAVVKSNRADFHRHLISHIRQFTCQICRAQFQSREHLQKHVQNHPADDLSFTCCSCGYKTTMKGLFDRHVAKFCKPDTAFQCAVCSVVKSKKTTLADHISICHPKDLIMCEICSKLLKSTIALNMHLQSHAAKRTFKCDQCDYGTWRKSLLRVHKLKHGEGALRCPHEGCTAVVKRRTALRAHIQRVHNDGVRPYACDRCEWTFANRQDLRRHSESHAGDRPYPCLICGYPFSQLGNRRVHMRTVHKLDPADPRLQPRLPAAYLAAEGNAPATQPSAGVDLAVQSDYPIDKIRQRRRRQPPFSTKKQSTSYIQATASSNPSSFTNHVTSADLTAPISANQILEISANQVASIISASQVATNPARHLAFNPTLTVPETHGSTMSTATEPCDVTSFYNPQFLDYQFQSFSGQF